MENNNVLIFKLSFQIIDDILLSKDYKTKDELMLVVDNALSLAEGDNSIEENLKKSYAMAKARLSLMSFDEIMEYKNLLVF